MQAVAADVRTECIHDAARLAEIRREWLALLERLASDNPFVRPEWVLSWWDTFGPEHRMATVAVWEDDTLIGLALLMTAPARHARLPATVLQFIGTPLADRMDLLIEPGRAAEVAACILDAVQTARVKWDVLSLREVPGNSPTLPAVRAHADARGWNRDERPCACAPVLPLARPYAALHAGLSRNLKRQLTKAHTRLRQRGAPAFTRRLLLPEDVGPALDTIVPIEQASWKGGAGVGIFKNATQCAFYRAALHAMAAAGLVDLALLAVDGTVVSYQLSFRVRGRCLLYNKAFLPAWANASPGILLLDELVRDSVDRRDVHVLDASRSMRVKPDSLAGWASEAYTHFELTLYPPRWYPRGLHLLHASLAPRWRAWRAGVPHAEVPA